MELVKESDCVSRLTEKLKRIVVGLNAAGVSAVTGGTVLTVGPRGSCHTAAKKKIEYSLNLVVNPRGETTTPPREINDQ